MKAHTWGSCVFANGAAARKMTAETMTTAIAIRRCARPAGNVDRNTGRSLAASRAMLPPWLAIKKIVHRIGGAPPRSPGTKEKIRARLGKNGSGVDTAYARAAHRACGTSRVDNTYARFI